MMVYDSLHTIGFIDERLQYRDHANALVGETGEESQYEAITVRTRTGVCATVSPLSIQTKAFLGTGLRKDAE